MWRVGCGQKFYDTECRFNSIRLYIMNEMKSQGSREVHELLPYIRYIITRSFKFGSLEEACIMKSNLDMILGSGICEVKIT